MKKPPPRDMAGAGAPAPKGGAPARSLWEDLPVSPRCPYTVLHSRAAPTTPASLPSLARTSRTGLLLS